MGSTTILPFSFVSRYSFHTLYQPEFQSLSGKRWWLAAPLNVDDAMVHDYCDIVANITVSVPDDVYDAARVKAAEARTSVSALVRDYLIRMAAQGSEFRRLVDLQEEILDGIQSTATGLTASQRLPRSAVHDRDALR